MLVPAASPSADASATPFEGSVSRWRDVFVWVALAALWRTLLAGLVPLLPDESYYWEWSRRLAGGYFDHPPGIALLIAAGTAWLGPSPAGVRAGPAVAALLTHLVAAGSAWQLAGRGAAGRLAARRAAQLFCLLPIATLGLVLATPDVLLFAAAMVALYGVERALASPLRSRVSLAWWLLAGLGLGTAFVAKYTAVLLPFGLVVACLLHPALRVRFTEPGPWVASVVALALFAPVVAWNASHDWVSFRFQLGHGFGPGPARGTPISRELEMLGGQAGLATPILFVLLAFVVQGALRSGWRARQSLRPTDVTTRRFALAVIALTPLLFFALSAWRRPVEANWPAMIYPAALLLLATSTHPMVNGHWWRRGLLLAGALLLLVTGQAWRPLLPLAPRKDPVARAHGWTTLADAVDRARQDAFLREGGTPWVAADRYQEASELAFHLPDRPTVFALNLGGRTNQYDIWPQAAERMQLGDGMVVAFEANSKGDSLAAVVGHWFAESRRGEEVVLARNGGEISRRRLWLYRRAMDLPAARSRRP